MMILKSVRHAPAFARAAMAVSLAAALGACGGSDSAGGGDGGAKATGDAPAGQPSNLINSFAFNVSDGVELATSPDTTALSISGGCASGSPLSIGFSQGAAMDDAYFHLAFDSVDPVVAGTTGPVELSSVTFDNGLAPVANLPADSGVKAPVRFSGPGTLTIDSHSGVGMSGRMAGVVEGEVTRADTDQMVSVSASFDINLACAAG